jgi:hypothetical protein
MSSLTDQIRYCIWRCELWGRNYGTNDDIDRDVEAGKLIPGLMPDAFWREGDVWTKQSQARVKGGR